MKSVTELTLFILVASMNIDLGSTVNCYMCISAVGLECDRHPETDLYSNCTYPTDHCQTLIANGMIIRNCAAKDGCDKYPTAHCKICDTDFCNTDSSGFAPGYSTSLVASLALVNLVKLFM